jgi:hypothetical protein
MVLFCRVSLKKCTKCCVLHWLLVILTEESEMSDVQLLSMWVQK